MSSSLQGIGVPSCMKELWAQNPKTSLPYVLTGSGDNTYSTTAYLPLKVLQTLSVDNDKGKDV